MVQLRHGYVKVPAQTVFQAAQHLPLIFQRSRVGNVDFEGEKTDRHVTHRRRIFYSASTRRVRPANLRKLLRRPRRAATRRGGLRRRQLLHLEALQDVADLHVVEIGDAGAALEAGANLADVFFEAPQRAELGRVDYHAVAHDAHLRIALEHSVLHIASRNHSGALDAERVAHLGPAQIMLLNDRLEQPFHGFLKFVGYLVDDRVRADIHFFLLRQVGRLAVRPDTKGNDDGAGRRREEHVVFGDGADTGADDFQLDLVRRELRQQFAQHFRRALHIGLDDDGQFLDLAGLELFVELVERDARAAGPGHGGVALLRLAVLNDVPRLGFIGHLEVITGLGHALQAQHFHRRGRRRFLDGPALVVKHGADFAEHRSANKKVAGAQRAVLHQHGSYGPAPPVHARLEHGSGRRRLGIGFQLAQIGDEQDHFQELIQIFLLLRGDFDHHRISAPLFRRQTSIGKLALDTLRLRFRLVNFIDGHDDGDAGGFGVVNGLLRLRHHAVVGRNHKNDNVGDLCAARAHPRESLVARRIHEHNALVIHGDLIRADVLRDSAGLAPGHVGFPNGIEQAGLAVVYVAHHGHDRRTRREILGLFFLGDLLDHLFFKRDYLDDAVERLRETGGRGSVERLVDAGEDAAVEQDLQDVLGANVELSGQVADRDAFRNGDFTRLARHRYDDRGGLPRTPLAHTGTCAYGMKFALPFEFAFIHQRPRARRRLSRIDGLARLGFGRQRRRQLPRPHGPCSGPPGHWLAGARRHGSSRACWGTGTLRVARCRSSAGRSRVRGA